MPQYYEVPDGDHIVIIVSGPVALQAVEKIGEVLKDISSRPAWNGRGRGGKEAPDRGTFKVMPDVSAFNAGDKFHVVAGGYTGSHGGSRVAFFSYFTVDGQLAQREIEGEFHRLPGAKLASIEVGSKSWENVFKEWKDPDTSNTPHYFKVPLILTLMVGQDKTNPAKKFSWIVKQRKHDQPDPDSLQYTEPQAAPAQNGS